MTEFLAAVILLQYDPVLAKRAQELKLHRLSNLLQPSHASNPGEC